MEVETKGLSVCVSRDLAGPACLYRYSSSHPISSASSRGNCVSNAHRGNLYSTEVSGLDIGYGTWGERQEGKTRRIVTGIEHVEKIKT